MTQNAAHTFSVSAEEQELHSSASFRFPQFAADLKEVRVKYNLIEE